MKQLRRWFDQAAGGERQVALLDGEPGVGKTRLLDEFAASLAEEGVQFRFTFGAAAEPGRGRPFHAFAEALLAELEPNDPAGSLARLLPKDVPAQAFADLLQGAPRGAELSLDQVRALFAAAFRALAAERPLYVVLDDMHLADENSVNLLAYFAHDDRSTKVLVVAAFRPPEEGDPLHQFVHGARDSNVHSLTLPRLGPKEVGSLLRAVLGSEHLVQELGFRILEKTEGNPFFVIEVLQSLKEDRVLMRRDDGAWTLAGTKVEIHVPDSVKELVQTNLARLGDEDRDLLDLASVQGMEFDPEVLSEILGLPKIPLLKRLSQLERRHRLIRSAGRKCRFDHQQLQETIYGSLLEGLREEYHAQIAQVLERRRGAAQKDPSTLDGASCLEIARHHVLGGRLDAALRYVVPALRHAQQTYKTDEGVLVGTRFLESARTSDSAVPPEVLVEVRLALSAFHEHDGQRAEEAEALEAAQRDSVSVRNPDLLRRIYDAQLVLHFQLGEFEAAEATCRESYKLAMERKDADAAVAALGNLGGALRSLGRYDEAAVALRRAVQALLPRKSSVRQCLLLSSLGMVEYHRGHGRAAQLIFLDAVKIAEAFGIGKAGDVTATHFPDDSLREQFLGLSRALGRYAESRIDGERMLLVQGTLPRRLREAAALLSLGVLAGQLDMRSDARGVLKGALVACREVGDARFEASVLHALGENALQSKDVESARRGFTEALELRRKIGYRPGVCESLLALGQLAALGGSVDAARPYLEEAMELAPALHMPAIAALSRATAALLYAREGRRDRARTEHEHAQQALSGGAPLSVSSRAEGLYFAALAARALGDETAYQTHMWRAYELIQDVAQRMKPEQRGAFLKGTSPNREIVAAVGGAWD